MVLTVPLSLQYQQDVLTRPEHMTGVSIRDDIANFLRYICRIAHCPRVFFLWRPRVVASSRTTCETLPGAGLRSISGLCPYVPGSFYTASGAESDEYAHRSITEVLARQN